MDQRTRTRVPARKQVTLLWSTGQCRGELANLSLKGCLLGPAEGDRPAAGQEVDVRVHLEDDEPNLDVLARARVVRQDAEGIALDFKNIELESFRHLFYLVQYNAADADVIESELGTAAFRAAGNGGGRFGA